MLSPANAQGAPQATVNLQTLVATVQDAVRAQNLIATNIAALTEILNVAFPPPTTKSVAWTPGGIANGASAAVSFSAPGSSFGQFVKSSIDEDLQGCSLSAYIQSAGIVEVVIANNTGGTVTFASTTVNVSIASS